MKMERSQQTTLKYKGSQETTTSSSMPIKWTAWEDMDKFLEMYNFPKLNQKETEDLNRPITSKEIETVIRNLSANKTLEPDDFKAEFYQKFREEQTTILLKFFQKIAEEGNLPNPFYKATITLVPKPKMPQKKKTTGEYH